MANIRWEAGGTVEGAPVGGWPRFSTDEDIPPAAIWRRLEHWTGRWLVKRPVTMIGNGPGNVTRQDVLIDSDDYEKYDLTTGDFVLCDVPLRFGTIHRWVPDGRFRFKGVAGMDLSAYPEIKYAAARFAEYLQAVMQNPEGAPVGAQSYSISLGGDVSESWRRGRSPVANALYESGAADLLRPFRRTKGYRFK